MSAGISVLFTGAVVLTVPWNCRSLWVWVLWGSSLPSFIWGYGHSLWGQAGASPGRWLFHRYWGLRLSYWSGFPMEEYPDFCICIFNHDCTLLNSTDRIILPQRPELALWFKTVVLHPSPYKFLSWPTNSPKDDFPFQWPQCGSLEVSKIKSCAPALFLCMCKKRGMPSAYSKSWRSTLTPYLLILQWKSDF